MYEIVRSTHNHDIITERRPRGWLKGHCYGSAEYSISLKGSLQLMVQGFPYTRHSCKGGKVYWRCVQFKSLGCRSRVRTHQELIESIEHEHNHDRMLARRKRGALKQLMQERKREKSLVALDQCDLVELDWVE
nr:FLYWCH-type zinc finger-containing protein 1-like [Aedes albopictus]